MVLWCFSTHGKKLAEKFIFPTADWPTIMHRQTTFYFSIFLFCYILPFRLDGFPLDADRGLFFKLTSEVPVLQVGCTLPVQRVHAGTAAGHDVEDIHGRAEPHSPT